MGMRSGCYVCTINTVYSSQFEQRADACSAGHLACTSVLRAAGEVREKPCVCWQGLNKVCMRVAQRASFGRSQGGPRAKRRTPTCGAASLCRPRMDASSRCQQACSQPVDRVYLAAQLTLLAAL